MHSIEELTTSSGRQRVHDVIERQHTAERGDWIAGEPFRVASEQSGLLGGAAGIVVLDDDAAAFEFGNQAAQRLRGRR